MARAPLLLLLHPPGLAPGGGLAALGERLAADGYEVRQVASDGAQAAAPERGQAPGVIGFGAACVAALDLARRHPGAALACFDPPDPEAFAASLGDDAPPAVIHTAGAGPQPVAPEGAPRVYRYAGVRPGFVLQGTPAYEPFAAGIAYARTLELLKCRLGPRPDLAGLFREHLRLEFEARDADATMRTMVDEPYVNHVPTMSGGHGHDELKRFYKYHFIPSTPRDRKTIILNEVVGADTVVIEAINCFTHAEPYDHYLPGVEPTGRQVRVPFVAIAKFRGDKLYYEHIYWDQASVLVQLGLLDPKGLPVCGAEQADKVLDPSLPSNGLMTRWSSSAGKPL